MVTTQFTIRRQFFTLLGAKFQIFDAEGNLVAMSRQKAFKLKEDIRLYRDEQLTDELLTIKARSIIDFSAAYDVYDAQTNEKLGTLQRRGLKSIVRDSWIVMDARDRQIGTLSEDSLGMALVRRVLPIVPQKFSLKDGAGQLLADFQTHFNPLVHKMTMRVYPNDGIGNRMVMAAGLLLMAIEGRQQ
jgi:hypothetical protein